MIQLWMFGLAIFGLAIHVFLETYAADAADERDLTPYDIIWKGAAKSKTTATVKFVLAIHDFLQTEFLEKTVGIE